MSWRWIRRGLRMAALVIVVLGVIGFAVMLLWNWLVPSIFGGPTLGFWQALGLLVLSRLLVGGLRGGGGHHEHWRHRMRERWERMTPGERARLQHFYRHHHGHGPQPEPPKESGT